VNVSFRKKETVDAHVELDEFRETCFGGYLLTTSSMLLVLYT
jgi:hypothetical protein